MISLARHIEVILLEHDCVIVPSFGGFIANHCEAQYDSDADGGMFLPPSRSIAFNQNLQINDGLLVQSYMQAYDAAYPEAYLQMEKDIALMNSVLDIEGRYKLDGIGVLFKDVDGCMRFTPEVTGLLTPGLYGLYSFEQRTLAEVVKQRELAEAMKDRTMLTIQTETDVVHDDEAAEDRVEESPVRHGEIVFTVSRRWVDAGIAAAAAIIFFIFISIPSFNLQDGIDETCIAGSLYVAPSKPIVDTTNIIQRAKADSAKADSAKAVARQDSIASNNDLTAAKAAGELSRRADDAGSPQQQPKPYVIVLASCVTRPNAEAFIKSIEQMGYSEARFETHGTINRVVYSAFETEAAAREVLQTMKKEKCFEDAWILKL